MATTDPKPSRTPPQPLTSRPGGQAGLAKPAQPGEGVGCGGSFSGFRYCCCFRVVALGPSLVS